MPAFVVSAFQAPRFSRERRPRQSLPRADELEPCAEHLARPRPLLLPPAAWDNMDEIERFLAGWDER